MKQLQSVEEGTWIEIKQVDLTAEQMAILASEDIDAQNTLSEYITQQRQGVATDADIQTGNAKYTEIKPTLKDTDVYALISMDIVVEAERVTGILNCRINGEHQQIRF